MIKSNKKNKASKGQRKNAWDLDMTYNGPIKIGLGKEKSLTLLVNRTLANNILSNGSGIVTNQYRSTDVTTVQDWASLQAVWKEYRVLAMELEYIPIALSSSSPICLGVAGTHNGTTTAPASMAEIAAYDSVAFTTSGSGANNTTGKKFFKYSYRASGTDELEFIDIASAITKPFNIYSYSTIGTASAVYFEVLQRFTIEFRGSA